MMSDFDYGRTIAYRNISCYYCTCWLRSHDCYEIIESMATGEPYRELCRVSVPS